MGWHLRPSDSSPGNVVSGSIRFMQIFAGVRWRGGVKWESFVHCLPNILHTCKIEWLIDWCPHDSFHVMQLTMTLAIFQGHWTVSNQISQERYVIRKSYYRLLIEKHTLAFDWCQFWWPWMVFKGHFTLRSPISRKLYRIRPQKLKLLIRNQASAFRWYECRWPWRYFKVIKLFTSDFS